GPNCNIAAAKGWGEGKARTITPKDDMNLQHGSPESYVGQARSFVNAGGGARFCDCSSDGICKVSAECTPGTEKYGKIDCGGYSYQTLLFYCQSLNYQSKKEVQYDIYKEDQAQQYQQKIEDLGGVGTQEFNEEILGVKYNDDGTVQNPYAKPAPEPQEAVMTCLDGSLPDANGCCAGEIYTDMGDQGFNCCPETGGDCFPPLI
ncbi:MAG: hypothetical protein IKW67_01475, partial [Alphaproteobacteria bacterium]|nr:hypothetical protein [Alphaproteobacteria bacterium]